MHDGDRGRLVDAPCPDVSIVIVNKDDPRIDATLSRLESHESSLSSEVIVVDASGGRLDGIRLRHPAVRWLDYLPPHDKNRTIAEQRNVGLLAAHGTAIAFLDANCLPEGGWLDALAGPVASGAQQVSVGRMAAVGSLHDRDQPPDLSPDGLLTEFSTMNVCLHREVFNVVGAFDEDLGYAEDVDLSWRAADAGIPLRDVPNAVVSHEWDSVTEDLRRAFRYGVARVRLYRKHPSKLRRLAGPDLSVAVYPLLLLAWPIFLVYPLTATVLIVPLVRGRGRRPLATLRYQLTYGAGVLSELLHVPVLHGQRHPRRAP
jgi:glycosyltransferase involved in cell wall biosynthesis